MTHSTTSTDHLRKLKDNTSEWFPTEEDTEKLLEPASKTLEDIDNEIKKVQGALYIQKAETFEEVKKFGEIVQVFPKESDSLDFYKKKVLTQYQQLSQTGNPFDILDYAEVLFEISKDGLRLENIENEPKAKLSVPVTAIESTVTDIPNAVEVLNEISAATYSISVIGTGTLNYISEADYNGGNWDSSKGYATLDSNGDITSGGTYGTLY